MTTIDVARTVMHHEASLQKTAYYANWLHVRLPRLSAAMLHMWQQHDAPTPAGWLLDGISGDATPTSGTEDSASTETMQPESVGLWTKEGAES